MAMTKAGNSRGNMHCDIEGAVAALFGDADNFAVEPGKAGDAREEKIAAFIKKYGPKRAMHKKGSARSAPSGRQGGGKATVGPAIQEKMSEEGMAMGTPSSTQACQQTQRYMQMGSDLCEALRKSFLPSIDTLAVWRETLQEAAAKHTQSMACHILAGFDAVFAPSAAKSADNNNSSACDCPDFAGALNTKSSSADALPPSSANTIESHMQHLDHSEQLSFLARVLHEEHYDPQKSISAPWHEERRSATIEVARKLDIISQDTAQRAATVCHIHAMHSRIERYLDHSQHTEENKRFWAQNKEELPEIGRERGTHIQSSGGGLFFVMSAPRPQLIPALTKSDGRTYLFSDRGRGAMPLVILGTPIAIIAALCRESAGGRKIASEAGTATAPPDEYVGEDTGEVSHSLSNIYVGIDEYSGEYSDAKHVAPFHDAFNATFKTLLGYATPMLSFSTDEVEAVMSICRNANKLYKVTTGHLVRHKMINVFANNLVRLKISVIKEAGMIELTGNGHATFEQILQLIVTTDAIKEVTDATKYTATNAGIGLAETAPLSVIGEEIEEDIVAGQDGHVQTTLKGDSPSIGSEGSRATHHSGTPIRIAAVAVCAACCSAMITESCTFPIIVCVPLSILALAVAAIVVVSAVYKRPHHKVTNTSPTISIATLTGSAIVIAGSVVAMMFIRSDHIYYCILAAFLSLVCALAASCKHDQGVQMGATQTQDTTQAIVGKVTQVHDNVPPAQHNEGESSNKAEYIQDREGGGSRTQNGPRSQLAHMQIQQLSATSNLPRAEEILQCHHG